MEASVKFIKQLGRDVRIIMKSVGEIVWYGRGGWGYYEVLNMSQAEREILVDIINDRLKIAEKSPFPVY
jgi:hypothetical protein